MALLRVGPLPGEALAASARFHAEHLPAVLAALADQGEGEALTLVFAPADHSHRGWRLSVVQGLAAYMRRAASTRWPATTRRRSRRRHGISLRPKA